MRKWILNLFNKKYKIWMGSFNMMHTFSIRNNHGTKRFYAKDKYSINDLPNFKFTPPPPTKNR